MKLDFVTKSNKSLQSAKTIDDEVVISILNNDSKMIQKIYEMNFEKIRKMVLNFNTHFDLNPKDIFQEGLVRCIINIRQGKFKGNSLFSTYLYSTCRHICLDEYKKAKNHTNYDDQFDAPAEEQGAEENYYYELLQKTIKAKNEIREKCREIIDLRFGMAGLPAEPKKCVRFEIIAEKLGIKADNARKRFERCLKELKAKIF